MELLETIEALGKLGVKAKEAIPGLIRALHDSDNLVRAEAAWAIGEIGNIDAFNQSDIYADKNLERDYKVSHHIEEGASFSLSEALDYKFYLMDTGIWESFLSKKALGTVGQTAVEALIESLKDDAVWEAATEALGKIGYLKAVSAIVKSSKGKNSSQTSIAAKAINNMLPVYKRTGLFSPLPLVNALCHLGDEAVLKQLVSDKDDHIRMLAVMAICELRQPYWLPVFLDILKNDSSEKIRYFAANGLGNIGKDALDKFDDVIGILHFEQSLLVRKELVNVIGWFRQPRAVPVLVKIIIDDDDLNMRKGAVVALMNIAEGKVAVAKSMAISEITNPEDLKLITSLFAPYEVPKDYIAEYDSKLLEKIIELKEELHQSEEIAKEDMRSHGASEKVIESVAKNMRLRGRPITPIYSQEDSRKKLKDIEFLETMAPIYKSYDFRMYALYLPFHSNFAGIITQSEEFNYGKDMITEVEETSRISHHNNNWKNPRLYSESGYPDKEYMEFMATILKKYRDRDNST